MLKEFFPDSFLQSLTKTQECKCNPRNYCPKKNVSIIVSRIITRLVFGSVLSISMHATVAYAGVCGGGETNESAPSPTSKLILGILLFKLKFRIN